VYLTKILTFCHIFSYKTYKIMQDIGGKAEKDLAKSTMSSTSLEAKGQ
jgi:hypothetical protein